MPASRSLLDRTTVVALSGNPRPGSRTATVARVVATQVADLLDSSEVVEVELAGLAGELFQSEHPGVDAARDVVSSATLLVVATPVYKASYTGLLKSFVDLYGPNALAGVTAVPVVISASPAHALVGEVHLRPLLVELGATVPSRALAITESQLGDLDAVVARWLETAAEPLRRSLGVGAPVAVDGER